MNDLQVKFHEALRGRPDYLYHFHEEIAVVALILDRAALLS